MELNDATLLTLAQAVADGSAVDWEHAESSAEGPDERHIVQKLRVLANVAVVARAAASTWGPLQIRGEVGGGTFGTVYRAWDTRLEREVALKLLNDEHAGHDLSSTVVKEGRLLAQIRHPNVVTVYGADVFDDTVGIWMEFVTGRTLKEIIQEQGPFGAHEAALIGRDLCRALAAVHKRGFLHRDIKAQNVMREAGGRTVLMDFGAGDALSTAASAPLTGTPAYLAPELLEGKSPSAQSDLYSLGVLLYYLVSGEFPVTGQSLAELRENHAQNRRSLLRDVRPDLPSAFVHAVDRATAALPSQRPETAGAMEASLEKALEGREAAIVRMSGRRLASALAALAVVAALAGAAAKTFWSASPTISRSSVAILPFKNLTSDPENDYFSAGITDDIAAQLTKLRELRVISGNSAASYRDNAKSIVEIGSELGVAAIVHGSVRRAEDRVRIVGQLFDARTGEQLWSETFEREIADIFQIQSEVSRKIALALKGELSIAESEWLTRRRGESFEAFNLYLKGRYNWSLRSEEGFRQSLRNYEEAIARYPDYARAYAGMADTYSQMGAYGMMLKTEALSRASAAASKAVTLDGSLAEAHASLGYIEKNRFEWSAADASLRRALELTPAYAPAHHWYSILLTQHGRFPEAIAEIKTAISLDPLSISANTQLGAVLLLARRYDDAIAQFEKVLQMDPTFATAHQVTGEAYSYKGEYDRAMAAYAMAAKVVALGREDHEQLADVGYALAMSGRRAEAVTVLSELLARERRQHVGIAANIATVYAALGETDRAFLWLTRAWERRESEVGYLKVDPRWDSLRGDPRFDSLLAQVGFR